MTEIALGSLVVSAVVMLLTVGLLAARARLLPQGSATVTVNGARAIEAGRGEVLLNVLHGAGIQIPAGCGGSGTCGLCRVTVDGEGGGEPKATERGILSPAERRAHVRLACQVGIRGPVEVTVPEGILEAESFTCRVRSNRMMAPLIRELVLDVPEGVGTEFRAGDFMQLTAPSYTLDFARIEVDPEFRETWRISRWHDLRSASDARTTRAYSIANRPEDAGRLVFNIRLAVPPPGREGGIPPGIVSSWLFSLNEGDAVEASGPFGDFHAQPTTREMVFIGGGVGMAPLRAMIHEQIARGSGRRIRFFYGARTVADLFYVEEFERLEKTHPQFDWTPVLSDPAPGDRWTGPTGFVHQNVASALQSHPAPEDCEYYLCGPPVMISAVIATLTRLGVERRSIFNDDFGT